MAMRPFTGYNMADYFGHWLDMGKGPNKRLPKVFAVNWFRKQDGKFLWPGFGDNARVLKWMCERIDGTARANASPVGLVPTADALDLAGSDVSKDALQKLLRVDGAGYKKEVERIREFYALFGDRIPKALLTELDQLESRVLAN